MATRTPKPLMEDVGEIEKPEEGAAIDPDDGSDTPVEIIEQLKMKGLVEAVVERTGQRKGEVRTAVQAALAVMGETLADGKELNLPPMGKVKINRVKETPRGQNLILKLVRNRKSPVIDHAEDDPLAEFEQDV